MLPLMFMLSYVASENQALNNQAKVKVQYISKNKK